MPSDFDDKNSLTPPPSFLNADEKKEKDDIDPNSFFMDLVASERGIDSQNDQNDDSSQPPVSFTIPDKMDEEYDADVEPPVSSDAPDVFAHSQVSDRPNESHDEDVTSELPYDPEADMIADLELDAELSGVEEGLDDTASINEAVILPPETETESKPELGLEPELQPEPELEPKLETHGVDADAELESETVVKTNASEVEIESKPKESFEVTSTDALEVDIKALNVSAVDEVQPSSLDIVPDNKENVDFDTDEVAINIFEKIEAESEQADAAPSLTDANSVYRALEEDVDGGAARRRIGDELIKRGLITQDQLNVALQEKKISGKMLGAIFVELGFIGQSVLMEFLAEDVGVSVFDIKNISLSAELIKIFDRKAAQKLKVLPVKIEGNNYYFAMLDPQDVVVLDSIRSYLPRGVNLIPLLAAREDLSEGIDQAYGYASAVADTLKELEEGEISDDIADLDEKDAFSHPIVRLVNSLVFEAVKLGVSDLHFEPEENFVRLRYRLDGVLYTAQTLHKQHWSPISQRLKIMSGMDIADKINPQDGRFNLSVAGREADFRVSSLPTVHGENIVLRVLDKSESIMPMSALGFSKGNRDKIKQIQAKPEGIIIVTGPTGSGKTTSLYSMLNEINDVEVNIQTLEDPVEYSLPMIRQTHVREGVLEFADGIKALLRQDPDIIFIGEIRDKTTAGMALKAAMTGHQVYTSLHTNDSFGAIPRLLDLELKPGMLAGAIVAIFAQRLARRLCPQCKQEFVPDDQERSLLDIKLGDELGTMYSANPKGCSNCVKGYKGRVALVEILMFDAGLDDILARGGSVSEMRREAVSKGFKSMADDAILKVKEGITDLSAVSKVVDITRSTK